MEPALQHKLTKRDHCHDSALSTWLHSRRTDLEKAGDVGLAVEGCTREEPNRQPPLYLSLRQPSVRPRQILPVQLKRQTRQCLPANSSAMDVLPFLDAILVAWRKGRAGKGRDLSALTLLCIVHVFKV